MKPKVYLETTIPSYLASRPSRDVIVAGHQKLTHEWWSNRRRAFQLYVSQFVLEEINLGDRELVEKRKRFVAKTEVLEPSTKALELAEALVQHKAIPKNASVDAAHISVATVHKMDYLLTWNCKHIANAEMIGKIEGVCQKLGYVCPVVCTPAELMGGK